MNPDLYLVSAIIVIAVVTVLTRAIPFLVFGGKELPGFAKYLGNVLPPAIMIILVCYCVRNMQFGSLIKWLPDVLSVAVVAAIHFWKRNMYLSIIVGTICYMILIRVLA